MEKNFQKTSRSAFPIPLKPETIKITKSSPYILYRYLTSQFRMLPDFIIIGAQKSGTSSLYHYLSQHQNVKPALQKEIYYFDLNFEKNILFYRAHFPLIFNRLNIFGKKCVTGECSPYYIFHPSVPKRISKTIPSVKIIVLLRNPIDRAFSHHTSVHNAKWDTLSFEDAIKVEDNLISSEKRKIIQDKNYLSLQHRIYSYLARGIYADQLKEWMNFFPKKQFMIFCSEDFFKNPNYTLTQIHEFLGIPKIPLKDHKKLNVGKYTERLNQSTRKKLIEYYRPHNEELYKFLGRRFNWDC